VLAELDSLMLLLIPYLQLLHLLVAAAATGVPGDQAAVIAALVLLRMDPVPAVKVVLALAVKAPMVVVACMVVDLLLAAVAVVVAHFNLGQMDITGLLAAAEME
jgi:hypothetical protein